MHVAARARLFLARRPWVYWVVVLALAAGVAAGVQHQLDRVAEARARWATERAVAVAVRAHAPGDPLETRRVTLPVAAVPPTALDQPPGEGRARQHLAAGEVVVAADVMPPAGPAAGADPGTLVVAVSDPLARDVRIGIEVRIAADGIALTADARVVEVIDDVVFVAVAPDEAPVVAAAARSDRASLLFVP